MQSKAEEAYQIIKHKIIMLEMRPTSDVSEEELIQELGISRTPIREAIQRLAKDRFVIIYALPSIRASCPCCSCGAVCRALARFQRWLVNIRLLWQWRCSCSLRS